MNMPSTFASWNNRLVAGDVSRMTATDWPDASLPMLSIYVAGAYVPRMSCQAPKSSPRLWT
jgi:hypothetical protein